MIKQIAEKWRGFWRMASNVALSMDADPLEDIHRRIRRLEAAVFQSEVGREPVAASASANLYLAVDPSEKSDGSNEEDDDGKDEDESG
jgi:hypothetical protein